MVRLSDHWNMRSRAVPGVEGLRGGFEAFDRSANDAGPDLPAAAARQAGIEHRGYAGLDDLHDIDRRWRAAVAEVGDLVIAIFADRDLIHGEVHLDHGFGRAALVVLQREGRRLGKPAEAYGLVDQALAADPLNVVGGEPFEQPGRYVRERPVEPFVAQPADPDRDPTAREAHRGHDAAGIDATCRVGHSLAAGHRQPQEEVVAGRQVPEGLQHLPAAVRTRAQQVREQLPAEQQGRCRVAAVQLVAHVQGAAHDRLEWYPAGSVHRRADRGSDHPLDMAELVAHAVVVGAIVEALARLALVEVAAAGGAVPVIAHHKDRHRGGIHAGHGADAAVVMARTDDEVVLSQPPLGVSRAVGEALVQGGVDQRRPLAADIPLEWHRGSRRQDRPVGHARQSVPRRRNADQHRLGLAHALEREQVGLLARGVGYHAAVPPSTGITAPVTNDARDESRNSTTSATSSVRPSRPSGTCAASAASPPDIRSQAGAIGTSIKPGATVLTRIPRDASSQAATLVSPPSAAFEAEYIPLPPPPPTAPP